MANFSSTEHDVTSLFPIGKEFDYDSHHYQVIISGKPKPSKGECKTDTYIKAIDERGGEREFKISIKQDNAEFLENKMTLERAVEIFGTDAQSIIKASIEPIKDKFEKDYLVYISKHGKTEAKSITLGWRFELLRNDGGKKSGTIALTRVQKLDIYAGTGLSNDKKNSKVDGVEITNSGVANMYLEIPAGETDLDAILKSMIPMDSFVDSSDSDLCFACKALNYRVARNKWEGNRSLSVYVDWSLSDGKLKGTLIYDNPLQTKGNAVAAKLKKVLKDIGVNADNFSSIKNKVVDGINIYEV